MIFAAGIGLLTLIGGLYFSGFMALLLLNLNTGLLEWDTYVRYIKAIDLPQVQPYVDKIKVAGYVGFGLPSLAYLALLVLILKPSKKSMHGDARFATSGDLSKHGLFKPSSNGIIVGKFNGNLVRLSGQQFVILAAPTRSGKGVGVVIPNLLEYQESIVVLDIKQENFELTSGWRASQGQEVYLFNPFAEDRRTHRWNPLSYVSPDPAFRISDLQSIAAMLYPDGSGDQKFWVSQARNAFTAFALYLFENFDDQHTRDFPVQYLAFPTLGHLYRLSSGNGTDLKEYLRGLSQQPFLSNHARTAFANLLSQAEETFASIMGTFKEPLNPWINPILDAATSANDFLLTDVRRKKMTLYIGIQPNKLAEARLILNLFFSQLINVNTKELPQNNPALKHQCLLLMDEFTAIGKIDILAASVAYMAGYNLRLLPIIQSMAQLDAVYGKDVSRTILTNHALQIIYAPREQQDANDYSDMLGYTTVRKHNVTRGRDFTRSESEERRALMLPQELKALGNDKEVFLYEGIPHPVMCQKIKYYQDKYFTKRLLPKVEIRKLTLEGDAPMLSKTTHAVTAAASLALAACASQPATTAMPTQEMTVMNTNTNGPAGREAAAAIRPKFNAEQVLLRLLELIQGSKTIRDFTPERLSSVMGLELSFDGADRYGAGEMLTAQWSYGFDADRASKSGSYFSFSFIERAPDRDLLTTDICQLDFDRFSAELEAMGFARETIYGEHGNIIYYVFRHSGLTIDVGIRGEGNEPSGKPAHFCVTRVVVK